MNIAVTIIVGFSTFAFFCWAGNKSGKALSTSPDPYACGMYFVLCALCVIGAVVSLIIIPMLLDLIRTDDHLAATITRIESGPAFFIAYIGARRAIKDVPEVIKRKSVPEYLGFGLYSCILVAALLAPFHT